MEMGEKDYYTMIYTLTTIPSERKSQLDDIGIDYETISDFELFLLMRKTLSISQTNILFGDLDLTNFIISKNQLNDEIVLFDSEKEIVIDRIIYQIMVDYIRKMHGIKTKVEKAGNAYTRQLLIDEARQKSNMHINKPFQSQLQPLVSAMVNSEGFKYNLKDVRNVKIYEFMDSVQRIQLIKSASSLLSGVYSGSIDTTKINKKELNWLRELK